MQQSKLAALRAQYVHLLANLPAAGSPTYYEDNRRIRAVLDEILKLEKNNVQNNSMP